MDKTIHVTLSPEGIDDAISELKAFKEELNAKSREFARRLADEGIEVVNANMPGKTYSEKGIESGSDPSHNTYVEISSSGSSVTASLIVEGQALLFIEFGAGVHYNGAVGTSPHPLGGGFGYTIGSYGKGHGAQDVWGYNDGGGTILSYGTQASMPVYKAYVDMREKFMDVAREVFG